MTRQDGELETEMDVSYKKNIQKLVEIGLALSSEKDINRLLEMIVNKAREMANADAGTLYIMDKDKKHLAFKIVQNSTLRIRLGGPNGEIIRFPPVPMELHGKRNLENVSSHVALTGKSINIENIYNDDKGFDFIGTKKYDARTGYKTMSMLVIPLKNYEEVTIGVLQLINAYDSKTKKIVGFLPYHESLIGSLASQAAIALTNANLIQNLRDLLSAFLKSMAAATDAKSPYTGGHIKRVVDISMLIAHEINQSKDDIWQNVSFSNDELEELQIAAWMHDIGKIVTPEHVIDKATKLEKIMDRIDLIETRFQLIISLARNEYLTLKQKLSKDKGNAPALKNLKKKYTDKIHSLKEDLDFLKSCNNTGDYISHDKIDRIRKIGRRTFRYDGQVCKYLSEDEEENLCIEEGTLNKAERLILENHAIMTRKITGELPFPEHLARISEFASAHHERPNGTGYPDGIAGTQLAVQSRILAVADIFEALTAGDRPYRKPMKLSKALQILNFMRKDNHIDGNIYDLFVEKRVYREYAKNQLNPEQIDVDI